MKIAAISVARSDFGRLFPTLEKISKCNELSLELIVAGNHTVKKFGGSISEIEKSGLKISKIINHNSTSIADISADILTHLSAFLNSSKPDYIIILGDRFEMLAAAQAAFLSQIKIIHIGGGYQTAGAIDDRIRHAISQLSDIHLTATVECQKRVQKMVQKKENIFLTGAPDLEILLNTPLLKKSDFYQTCQLNENEPFILVTLHPETLCSNLDNKKFVDLFEKFLEQTNEQILFTAPCADPGNELIFEMIHRLKANSKKYKFIESLGMSLYTSALHFADMMIGNSSSGIIEAATMGTPVMNVGNRQKGREQNTNVVNARFDLNELSTAYKTLKSKDFRQKIQPTQNIYGDGSFSTKFIELLKNL